VKKACARLQKPVAVSLRSLVRIALQARREGSAGGVNAAVVGTRAIFAPCLAGEDFAAAAGDVARLLDVDVHRLAREVAFVASYDMGRWARSQRSRRPVP
jgi:hypothetical protein